MKNGDTLENFRLGLITESLLPNDTSKNTSVFAGFGFSRKIGVHEKSYGQCRLVDLYLFQKIQTLAEKMQAFLGQKHCR